MANRFGLEIPLDIKQVMKTFKKHNLFFVDVSKRIGFTASVSNSSTSLNNGTLVFPEVIANVRNGYNETNLVFTAPIAGEYVFFVNLQSHGNQHIYMHIMLNGVDQITAIIMVVTWQC